MPNPVDYLFELQQPLSAKLIGSTNPDENNTMITQIKRVSFNYSDTTMVLKNIYWKRLNLRHVLSLNTAEQKSSILFFVLYSWLGNFKKYILEIQLIFQIWDLQF